MCRSSVYFCILCYKSITHVIPCQKKCDDSPLITLFKPTECIDKTNIILQYHRACAIKIYGVDKMTDGQALVCISPAGFYIDNLSNVEDMTLILTSDGKRVHHPEPNGTGIDADEDIPGTKITNDNHE